MRYSTRILLHRYPDGVPREADFEIGSAPVPELAAGQVLVETHWLSMDPAPRLRMSATAKFPPPIALGSVVPGRGVGIVRASADPAYAAGDTVAGDVGWQELAVVPATQLRPVDTTLGPIQSALGLLGPSGIAAWFLVNEAARVQEGDWVVVTAAAGAVGSTLVQLARLAGAHVIGLVGGTKQARFVREQLGAASVIDHRSATLSADLAAACPQGVNVFLDSVGGAVHNAVMDNLAVRARIVAFGYISAYNAAGAQAEYGRIYQLIHRRAQMQGFLVGDYAPRFPEALGTLSRLLADQKLRTFEHYTAGLASAPAAFATLFDGDPVGKQLVRIRL